MRILGRLPSSGSNVECAVASVAGSGGDCERLRGSSPAVEDGKERWEEADDEAEVLSGTTDDLVGDVDGAIAMAVDETEDGMNSLLYGLSVDLVAVGEEAVGERTLADE